MSDFQYTIPIRDRTISSHLTRAWTNIWNRIGPLGLVNYLQHSRPPPQPHGFTSKAFVANGVVQPIPAPYFSTVFRSWRLASLLQLGETCLWSIWLLYMFYGLWSTMLILELGLVLPSLLLQKYNKIKEPWSLRRIYRWVKDREATGYLLIVSRMGQAFPILSEPLWSLFWSIYFVISVRRKRFTQNYTEAWRKEHPNHAISVFFDRSSCIRIPCRDLNDPACDDAWLLKHLSFFYRISRIEEGVAPVLLPKSLIRLEVVKIKHGSAAGAVISTLDVSPEVCVSIEDFVPLESAKAQRSLIGQVVQSQVYQDIGLTNPPNGLKFVVGWDTSMISNIILLPTLLSIGATVAWPIIAVRRFGEQVQDSVQTGTAVGGYIITAGALVVGLVTLFDALAK